MADQRRRNRGRRSRGGNKRSRSSDPAVVALEALRRLVRDVAADRGVDRSEALPLASMILKLDLPVSRFNEEILKKSAADLRKLIDAQIDDGLRASRAFRQGTVFSFLYDSVESDQCAPPEPTSVFAGYQPNGRPEWVGFTNLCIARGEERVDRLFGDHPEVIAFVQTVDELGEGLLPEFGRDSCAYKLLGQVVLGLVPEHLMSRKEDAQRVALTFQLVETRLSGAGPRLRLNVLGLTPEQIANAAADSHRGSPAEGLRKTLRATQRRVDTLGRQMRVADGGEGELELDDRVHALLTQLRGDLEGIFRAHGRRTSHARDRHTQSERPTSDAMRDLTHAPDDRFLWDTRRETAVVIGPKGRAHVFSPEGLHVTSLRLSPGELERKKERGRWRPLRSDGIASLRGLAQVRG